MAVSGFREHASGLLEYIFIYSVLRTMVVHIMASGYFRCGLIMKWRQVLEPGDVVLSPSHQKTLYQYFSSSRSFLVGEHSSLKSVIGMGSLSSSSFSVCDPVSSLPWDATAIKGCRAF